MRINLNKTRRATTAVLAAALAVSSLALVANTASAGVQETTNACRNSATGTFTDIDITMGGTASGDASSVTLGDTTLSAFFPAGVLVAGYNLGLLTVGLNNIPGTLEATVLGSNTSEGSRTISEIALSGQTTITDPDGTPGNGDETATDLSVTVPIPDTTWTPTGGDIAFSADGSTILASLLGGRIRVAFTCEIGTSTPPGCVTDAAVDCTGFNAAVASPFETFEVVVPPASPTCEDGIMTAVASGSGTIDLAELCMDENDDVDPSSFQITQPSDGSVEVDAAGLATYTAGTLEAGDSEEFGFSVNDLAGTGLSDEATVTVNITASPPPVCVDAEREVQVGASFELDLVDLCTDDDLDATTAAITTEPTNGTFDLDEATGVVTYTAGAAAGSDSFGYTLSDAAGETSLEATVDITITEEPAPATTTTTTSPTTTTPPPTTTAPPSASSGSYSTDCTNSVTPDASVLEWTVSAIAPATAVAGDDVVVSSQSWSIVVAGSVLDAGVRLGLISAGEVVNAEVTATLNATNTAEGSRSQSGIPIAVTVALDAAGAAEDVAANFDVGDMVFTGTGGDIDLSIGDVSMAVTLGALPVPVTFTCSPTAGQSAFHTVAVSGTTPTTTTVATQVQGQQELAVTGLDDQAFVVGLIGFLLLNFGYLTFSSTRPKRSDRKR